MKTRKDAPYSTHSKVLDIFTDSAAGGRKEGRELCSTGSRTS